MKQLTYLLYSLMMGASCMAQTLTMDKIPVAVSRAFKVKFPDGSQPGWTKQGPGVFGVSFFNGKKMQSAEFDSFGKWLKTESEINFGKLPSKVQNAFTRQFEGYQVQEVYEVQMAGGDLNYEIIAFNASSNFTALFSAKGDLINKEDGLQGE